MERRDGMITFQQIYALNLIISLLLTHSKLKRYARYVKANTTFGHWYYPLKQHKHATFFGVVRVPYLSEFVWEKVFFTIFLTILSLISLNILQRLGNVYIQQLLYFVLLVVSIFYFARVRTHGLIHNKADTVPWVLAIFCFNKSQRNIILQSMLLLSLCYSSSGWLKIRKQGISWAKGINLRRLVGQFFLELQLTQPNTIQKIVLQYPVIGMLAQPCVLSFECFFPLVLFYNYSYILNITCIALILFGVSFHIGCLILFQIDFIHFWLPTYWSFLFYLKDEAMIKVLDNEAFLYHPLTIFMLISFVIAHIRVHSGLNWPNSSFDLYNTKLTKNKINYHALQLISNDNGNNIVPFDLSICSSSGMTRSFGYHYSKLLKNNDLNEFIHVFLPKLLIAEGYIYHGKLGFKGVQIVEIIIDIKSEGGYTLNPARLVGRYFWSYE
eukprot:g7950.t1